MSLNSDYQTTMLASWLPIKSLLTSLRKQLPFGGDAKQVSNWLQGEVAQFLNAEGKTLEQIELTPET